MTTLPIKALDLRTMAQAADWLAVGVAVSLPWSTTATGILIVLWLLAVLPTLDVAAVRREVASWAGGLPVVLWLVAAVGMLWADVSWPARIDGLGGYHRLLVIPLLLAQFRRSERGIQVFYWFLVSAIVLLAASWATALIPALAINGKTPGVPVKDYVLQSGIFLICAMALIGVACDFWRSRNKRTALALVALAALFLANIAFVITSRTVLVVAPFLAALLGWRQLRQVGVVVALLVGIAVAAGLWLASPPLRERTLVSFDQVRAYFANNDVSSTAEHLEFIRESIRIVETAPVIGHGTGSIAEQYRQLTAGQTGVSSVATVNPHNQISAVAIELGFVGTAVLLAMWAAHFMLFRGFGLAALIGEIVVVQNVVSSFFNSHLFDFSQGWLYVFGVGVAGGMVLRERDSVAKEGS
ncbi:MAG TPA: O-antigen ligase family protein [Xanthobacteraceae bacterium]|nr:O-antigen ligase family protein [Xanthobacteraceae bacterium]